MDGDVNGVGKYFKNVKMLNTYVTYILILSMT